MEKSEQRQKVRPAPEPLPTNRAKGVAALALIVWLVLAVPPAGAQETQAPTAAPEPVITPPPSEPVTPPPTEPEQSPAEPAVPAGTEQPAPAPEASPPPVAEAETATPIAAAPEAAPEAAAADPGNAAAEPLIVETPMPVSVPEPRGESGGAGWLWLLALVPIAILIALAWLWRRRVEDGWRSDYLEENVAGGDIGPEPVRDAPRPAATPAPLAANHTSPNGHSPAADVLPEPAVGEEGEWTQSPEPEPVAEPFGLGEAEPVQAAQEGSEPTVPPAVAAEELGPPEEERPFEAAPAAAEGDASERALEAPAPAPGAAMPVEELQAPPVDRPLLELMMQPLRAGTTEEETRVEFELTIGNVGSVEAEGVRISSWMFAAGSVQPSSMEQMLLDPPAETTLGQVTIPSGSGARIRTSIGMPRSMFKDSVLPVVVADARYPLPGGGQSRISASFAIGRLIDGDLEPFSVEEPGGLEEGIGWRLYGEVYSD